LGGRLAGWPAGWLAGLLHAEPASQRLASLRFTAAGCSEFGGRPTDRRMCQVNC